MLLSTFLIIVVITTSIAKTPPRPGMEIEPPMESSDSKEGNPTVLPPIPPIPPMPPIPTNHVCSLPKKIGPCRGSVPRFYFDSATKRCTGFRWGGCRPNGNNFKTTKECKRQCGKTQECPDILSEVCELVDCLKPKASYLCPDSCPRGQCGKRCRSRNGRLYCPRGQRCRLNKDKCHMTCEPGRPQGTTPPPPPPPAKCKTDKDCPRYGYCDPIIGECGYPVMGRPFVAEGMTRTTVSHSRGDSHGSFTQSWAIKSPFQTKVNTSADQERGHRWLEQAEGEHASVASFAKNSLHLLSAEAPSDLLLLSQSASLDEIRHAKVCYQLASQYLGDDFEPGQLDVEKSLEKRDLQKIAKSTIEEGCVAETIAAVEAHFRANHTKVPMIKAALLQIALEETNHAQLAWTTVGWMMERFPEVAEMLLEEAFVVEFEKRASGKLYDEIAINDASGMDCDAEVLFRDHGIIDPIAREKIGVQTIQHMIKPKYWSGLQKSGWVSEQINILNIKSI